MSDKAWAVQIAELKARIAELESLLSRVQVAMGVKRLPDKLMVDIRKAMGGGE